MRRIAFLMMVMLATTLAPASAQRVPCAEGWNEQIIALTQAQARVLYVQGGDAEALVQSAKAVLNKTTCFSSL